MNNHSVTFKDENINSKFNPNGLSSEEVLEQRKKYGWNEHSEIVEKTWKKIVRRYLSLVPIILLIAAILSVSIVDNHSTRDWFSFCLLIFLVNLTVWADFLGERSAKNAITALEALSPSTTFCKRDNKYIQIMARELVPGDVVRLKGGVVIPADGCAFTISSTLQVDESSLTGESLPVTKIIGSIVLSGSVVQRGEGEIYITDTGSNSFFGKTISLLGKADTPGHLRSILDKAAKIITLIATLFSLFLFFWILFKEQIGSTSSNKGLLALKNAFVLVASVTPAAMPVVTTTVLAVGAKIMSKEQAIVNRLSAIEEAAGIEILCSDKTGTLTKNELSIYDDETLCEEGISNDYLFMLASLASSYDEDMDPIDYVINNYIDKSEREKFNVLSFSSFNPVDKRTIAHVQNINGEKFLVSKGAPQIIKEIVTENGQNRELANKIDKIINIKAEKGLRTLGVAYKQEGSEKWKLCGYISLFDPPREDTYDTIAKSIEMGIEVKMITGDQQAIAIETARRLGLGTNIVGPEVFSMKSGNNTRLLNNKTFSDFILQCNGFAGMYPEHKFNVVDALLSSNYLVGMTGDGVNDAPALKLATVGIAVAGATEAAKSAADIVLLQPGLSSIIKAFSLSRKIFKRIESYITFRIFTSVYILIFIWSSTVFINFRFPSWTLVLISLINDFTLMSCAYDHVPTSKSPLRWSMLKITLISVWMAIISSTFSIVFVIISDPLYEINWWTLWGAPNLISPDVDNPIKISSQTNAAVWLLLTITIQLSFHSCRTRNFFFLYKKNENKTPNVLILILQAVSILITFFLSVYWEEDWRFGTGSAMRGLTYSQALLTVFLSFIFFIITDFAKVAAYNSTKLNWSELNLFNIFFEYDINEKKAKKLRELQKLVNEEMDKRFLNQTGSFSLMKKVESQNRNINLALLENSKQTSPILTYNEVDQSILTTKFDDKDIQIIYENFNARLSSLEAIYDKIRIKLDQIEVVLRNNFKNI